MTNKIELEYAIKKAGLTKGEFAKKLGISLQTLYNKINNNVEFKASEIIQASKILKLDSKTRNQIFFAKK